MIEYFNKVDSDLDKGIEGKNLGIPTGFKALDLYTSAIQKARYTIFGGQSGCGKTSYVDLAYVINPITWLMENLDKTDYRYHVIYRSMERPIDVKIAKWTCLVLYKKYKIIMDLSTFYQSYGAKYKITPEIKEKILECKKEVEKLFEYITLIGGASNPTGLMREIEKFATNNGQVIQVNEYNKMYKPNNDNLVVTHVTDHIGKEKSEHNNGAYLTDKGVLDKHSEYMGIARDFYGFSPIDISQFNRGLSNVERMKTKDVSPEESDFKGTSDIYENADLALALYNPSKIKDYTFLGYDIKKFIDEKGRNRFRSLSIIKNSYDADDLIIGLNFLGECGYFREIPDSEEFRKNPSYYERAKNFEI